MVMVERYGIPSTRIISLIEAWQYPTHAMQSGDQVLILTDDAMDPLVWQSAMASIKARGAEPALLMFPRMPHNGADPPQAAIEASHGADIVWALLSRPIIGGGQAWTDLRTRPDGTRVPVCLMEEMTVEILTEGAGGAKEDDIKQVQDLERRIREVYDRTKWIHITAHGGTDITADISGMPKGYFVNYRSIAPHSRDPKTGKLHGGTWPTGEVHVEPVPGTANGVVVWDITAHVPPGRWKDPVALTIKDGKVVSVDGQSEATELVRHIEKYGDENTWLVGGEMSVGTNHLAQPNTFMMRSEKKRYGQMHFGIGTGADRGIIQSTMRIEGIVDRVSIVADETVICENGNIVV